MQVAKVEMTYTSPRPFEQASASCTITVLAGDGETISEQNRLQAAVDARSTVQYALNAAGKAPVAVIPAAAAPSVAAAPATTEASPTKPPKSAKAATAPTQTTVPSVAAALGDDAKIAVAIVDNGVGAHSPEAFTADDIKKVIPQKVKELGGDEAAANKLRDLVQKFKPTGWDANVKFTSANLPAEKRGEFIAAVKALTKGASKDDI